MPKFGIVPAEVPVNRSLDGLAPKFRVALDAMLRDLTGGPVEWPFETVRTPERQAFLYGFGRDYDDGRGIVTHAISNATTFHGYGLAVDIVEKDATPWTAPDTFWQAIGAAATAHDLKWGGHWKRKDLPHVYWGKCPATPTPHDQKLLHTVGPEAVWLKYGAE